MSSVGILAEHMDAITTCEIDPMVAEGGQKFYQAVNRLNEPAVKNKWSLKIDDGRHFLRTTQESFDLIAFDVPAPATIQLALLASPEILSLAKKRLKPGGIVSMCASGTLNNSQYSRSVLAGFIKVFPQVVFVQDKHKGGLGYCFGGDNLQAFEESLGKTAGGELQFWSDADWLETITMGHEPISLKNLAAVREITSRRLRKRYGTGNI